MPLHGFLPSFLSTSEKETLLFSARFASLLQESSVVALHGDLGAGKTTFVKGILEAKGLPPTESVTSPTFSYLHIYDLSCPIFHFDLYRLSNPSQFIELGFIEYLYEKGICLIEWAEKIGSLLPETTIHIYLTHIEEGKRKIDVS